MTPDFHPPKFDLIRNHTPAKINRDIDAQTKSTLATIADDPHAIRARLWALDREWHVDRALIAVFSIIGGWCPPISVLRRIGFRTEKEIAAERTALEKRLAATTGI